jgi:uncharacterized protein
VSPRRPLLFTLALALATSGAVGYAGQSTPQSPGQGTKALNPELPKDVIAASFAPGSRWQPEKAVYGTTSRDDLPVTMADGTVLRVNVIYPTDPQSGKIATGPFPVLLTQTPYGKGSGGSSAPGSAQQPSAGAATGGANNYLAQRGYIEVVADVRGTGDSGGSWGIFDPIQTQDSITLVKWCAHLAHADGKVGTYGPSYLGINQMLLAGNIGKHSPLKAIFPMVAANDTYRDTSFMGGLIDSEFDEAYLGLTAADNTSGPLTDAAGNPPTNPTSAGNTVDVESDHLAGDATYHVGFSAQTLSGGPSAYDGQYWKMRSPVNVLDHIAANHIPAYLVGGEFDIFQRGEPLNYAGLQNAWAGRSATQPMRAGQRTTGRYQLIDGPWEHLNGSSVDVDMLELAWFDRWLKDIRTGIDGSPTPLHYYDLGTAAWTETTTYPFTGATPQRLYLGASGALTSTTPAASGGTDTLAWTGSGNPCTRSVDQWSMGGLSIPSAAVGVSAPCAANDAPSSQDPATSVSYTTAPLKAAARIAGPLSASLFASATSPDTEWVAQVEDVSPDGTATPLTEGALLGSLRAVDHARSWTAPGGGYLLPYHPYTQSSARAVPAGKVVRYDVEVFPTFATIKAGHAIRVTISTADAPHLSATTPELANLAGGVYTLEHSQKHASYLTLNLQH